jgi:hypothetical protein
MKAEHRKELETNLLADRMGRHVQRNKHRPERRAVAYFIVGFVVLIGLVILYRLHVRGQQLVMDDWKRLEVGRVTELEALAGIDEVKEAGRTKVQLSSTPDPTNAGKAARLQMARFYLWDRGVRILGADSMGALNSIGFAESIYNTILKDSEKDPDYYPEALYGLAVIEETRAIQNQDRLASAQKKYEELASSHKESGFAVLAEKRAKQLKDEHDSIAKLYRDLQTKFRVPPEKKADKLPFALP